MNFERKEDKRPADKWNDIRARYRLAKRIKQLEKIYRPVDIYKQMGCTKHYFYGLIAWRWDCKEEYLLKLQELENENNNT